MRKPTEDILFRWIEEAHAGEFGDTLDAGTGHHSFTWLTSLAPKSLTAITAEPAQLAKLNGLTGEHRVILGQWTDPALLAGESFDVVIADYLIGALDGHAPYFQYKMIPRLAPHVRSGGRLYLVGMEPQPIDDGSALAEVVRMRDACLLLGGHRCYREYPKELVMQWLTESGFRVLASESWSNVMGDSFIQRQLDVGVRSLSGFRDEGLREAMREAIESLRGRALAQGSRRFGSDWVIAAERVV